MNSGNYQAALEKFKALHEQPGAGAQRKEKSLRRMADCLYFIGARGSNQDLLRAVDLYKEILKEFPGSGEENAVALYRLAKSYEALKFYYEARKEYDRLAADFPESADAAEARFKAGEMMYKVRQFSDAADRLRIYIEKHPSGDYIKDSYFIVADCYSQLQRNDISSAWYQEILKRWPEWEKIPPDELYKLGSHYYRNGKYDDAIEILTLMMSMRPDGDGAQYGLAGSPANGPDIFFMIARSLQEKGQVRTALKFFSHLIETYPKSLQAAQAMIIMAGLGVEQPAERIPIFMPGSAANRDPVQAYNELLAVYPFHELTEELLFSKGYALYKYGRYEDSFSTFRYEASKYPQGRFKTQCMTNLLQSADIIIRRAYDRQDYLSVADIFLKIENDYMKAATAENLARIAESFHQVGIDREAISLYDAILKSGKATDAAYLKYRKAECLFSRGDLDEAEKLFAESLEHYRKDKLYSACCRKYLGDVSLKKRAWDKAGGYYAEALAAKADFEDGAAVQRNAGLVLRQTGSYSKALQHYQNAAAAYNSKPERYGADVFIDAYEGMGECLLKERKFKESLPYFKKAGESIPGAGDVLWPLLGEGKVYLSMRNTEQADRVFSVLREKGGEEFWAKIADYTVKENTWATQYGRFLRR
jgi:TolA-binding protein